MNSVVINNRKIGDGNKTYIIAEMSANHAGSLAHAKEIIHAAKEAGADCIKIQTYTADTLTMDCDNKFFQIKKGPWKGETLYSLYNKAYTPWDWQPHLKEEADNIGIDFFSTPFDNSAVDFLNEIGVLFYKVASFELIDIPLIKYIAKQNKPMIVSTGMATKKEISEAVDAIRSENNNDIILLKCSSNYPAVPSEMNLRTMVDLKKTFKVPVGLSDHTTDFLSAITAVSLGACVIEKHFCITKEKNNPDSHFSMEYDQFKNMVREIRQVEDIIGEVSYELSASEKENLELRKSIFVANDIKKGEKFSINNIRVIRPGYGLKPKYFDQIINKIAAKDIKKGTPLSFDHILEGVAEC